MRRRLSGRLRRLRGRLRGQSGVAGGLSGRLRAIGGAVGSRLSDLRYLLEDGLYVIGRVPAGIWRGAQGLWASLEVYTRRRLAAVASVLGAVALIWLVLIPIAPCQFPGGDSCPPGDDAEELVPAGALAYLHVNLESDAEQAELARELGAKLPTLTAELRSQLAAIPGLELDPGDWFAGEIASVLLPRGGRSTVARSVVLFEADDAKGAREFGRDVLGPGASASERGGVEIETAGGQASALIGGFLALGEPSAVARVVDTATGEAPALASDETAEGVRELLPDARLGDAYVSEFGARRLLRPGAGPLSLFEPFVNPAASSGAAAAVSVTDGGVEISIVSAQDEERAKQAPGFFGAFESFDPELPERLAAGTFAYLGLGRPAEGARELISSAAASAPALAAAIEGLARDLQRQGQISLVDQVLPLLGEEAAISIGPRGRETLGAVPYLALLTRGIDEQEAAKDLARLQAPLADAAGAEAGSAFEETEVDGTAAQALRVSPTLELTYAVLEGLLVFATQPDAISALEADESLADGDGFRSATSDLGGSPAALFFADLEGLVDLGEQAGLAEDPAYAVFASELRRLRELGMLVSREGGTIATKLRLLVD